MHLRSERQVSPHTLEAYRRDLSKVLAYCQKAQLSSWNDLDIQHLRSFTARQHQQGQSSRSLARMLSAVRGFYKYLNREGLCQHDPANACLRPKANDACPRRWIPTARRNCWTAALKMIFSLIAIRPSWSCFTHQGCGCPN